MSDIVEWLRDADYKNAPSRCIDAVREIESLRSSLVGMKALHESAVAAWIEAAKQRDALVKALDGIAEYCGGEDTTLGALHRLASIRNTADQALRGLVDRQGIDLLMADRAFLERLSRELVDQGKLIEAGWVSLRVACDLEDAPKIQLQEMRQAFFAGAQHLFSSIMTILEPDAEPTDKDLERMDLIDRELKAFINDFIIRNIPTEGSS